VTAITKLFARFTGAEIFLEQGRLLFSVLHAFSSGGLQIHLFDNLADKNLDKYGKLVYGIPGLVLTHEPPADAAGCLYLYDQPDTALEQHPWPKRVQVRFDLFAPFWTSNPIIMPFPMHPLQSSVTAADLQRLRSRQRCMRLFFSGDTHQYGRVWVRYPKTKLPRLQIVNAIKQRLGDDLVLVHDSASLEALQQRGYLRQCVITASSEVRIEFADWLPTLAQADFFLSPPGIVMPMCHNIIEAMSVGTIPITNYPEWMDPHLQPGVNCLTFDDEDDLIAALQRALTMTPADIARMRGAVIDYYDRHQRPQTFVDRVLGSRDRDLPVLVYTERNMARRTKQLGRHSILMHGTSAPRPEGRLRRWMAGYRS
jgi:hypothetical protein